MMRARNIILSGAMLLASVAGVVGVVDSSAMAAKCPKGSLRPGSTIGKDSKDGTATLADCNIPKDSDKNLMTRLTQIINVITGLVGIIAVAVIVIGGITFATSQGDAAKVAKAKNTILYGVVGLVVALLAWAIVNFVLSGVFGAS